MSVVWEISKFFIVVVTFIIVVFVYFSLINEMSEVVVVFTA